MDNQVPEQVKTVRSNELLALDKEKRRKYEKKLIGKSVEVLMEESVQADGKTYQVGHTKEYVKIRLESDRNMQNQFVNVQIQDELQIIH